MSSRTTRLIFTKLVNEPWFIDASHRLRDREGDAAYTITAVTEAWLEKRVGTRPEQCDRVEGITLSSAAVYRDGTMVGGIAEADPDAEPPAGSGYKLLVSVVITATDEYGGGQAGMVLEADMTIAANAVTAPAT